MFRRDRASLALGIGVATLVVGSELVGGFLIQRELGAVDRQLHDLRSRVADLARDAEGSRRDAATAAERADEALRRAVRAEESAVAAERQRDRARAARETAEERSRRDRHLAESARRDAAEARQEAERIRAAREAELQRLQETLGQIADTRRSAMGLVMSLGEDQVRFEFDKAELGADERELLSRIAGILLTFSGYRIQVFGHTDDVGTVEYNQELSERRAAAVREYLVDAGIEPDLITTRGYGKSRPLVDGTSPEQRAMNRRVEIGIIDTVVDYRDGPAGKASEEEGGDEGGL